MDYQLALKIANNYAELWELAGRFDFWDNNPEIFGLSSVVIFDTLKEEFYPYHEQPKENKTNGLPEANAYRIGIDPSYLAFDNLLSGTEREFYRYQSFEIYPHEINEFWEFVAWCVSKYKRLDDIEKTFFIMDKAYYWMQIAQHRFPGERVAELLTAAEQHRLKIGSIESPYGLQSITKEKAKDYFFFFGEQVATGGEGAFYGPFGAKSTLYSIYQDLPTCTLSDYGEIFYQYYDAIHTVNMVSFLRGQLKRLENEDEEAIRFPEVKQVNTPKEQKPIHNGSSVLADRDKQDSVGPSKKRDKPQRETLEMCFEHVSKVPIIINLLADKGYCDASTQIWTDFNVGHKSTVAELIKYLHSKGFYGKESMPSNREIVSIAKNTFGVVLGIDIVKKTDVGQLFSFINPASTY